MNSRANSVGDGRLAADGERHGVRGESRGSRWQRWWAERLRWAWRRWHARPPRQLRLRETLALGERRFLVVVEFGRQKFLIGSSGSAMVLLTKLESGEGEDEAADCTAKGVEAEAGVGRSSGIRLAAKKDVVE